MLVDMEISFTSILFKTFWKHSTYPIIINFFTVLLCTFQAIYKGMFMLPFCHIFDVKLTCPFLSIVSNLRFVILWKCSFEMSLLIWHNACFPLFPLSCNVVIWQCEVFDSLDVILFGLRDALFYIDSSICVGAHVG